MEIDELAMECFVQEIYSAEDPMHVKEILEGQQSVELMADTHC